MRKPPSPGRPSRANHLKFCRDSTPRKFPRQHYAFCVNDQWIREIWWSQRSKGVPLPVVPGIVIQGDRK